MACLVSSSVTHWFSELEAVGVGVMLGVLAGFQCGGCAKFIRGM